MKKVCPICDSVNRSTAFFCHACGSRLLTTIPPAIALAGEESSPTQPSELSEPTETKAEIEQIDEAQEAEIEQVDDDEITEISYKVQETGEAQADEAGASSQTLDIKSESEVLDISTHKLIPDSNTTEAALLASSDDLLPLSDESEAVGLEAVEQQEALPELLPVASEEEHNHTNEDPQIDPNRVPTAPLTIEAESVAEAVVPKEIDTDEASSPVSFKKKTANLSQERQNTTVLALPPEFEAKESAVNEIKQEEDKQQENLAPTASSEPTVTPSTSQSEGQLSALPPGTLIAKRFETIELLESDAESNLYSVYDRAACPSCGSTENEPEDNYCWECGFDFTREHEPVRSELREALSDDKLDGYEGERFVDHQRFYLRQEEETTLNDPPSTQPVQSVPEPQGIILSVGYQSDTGMVRQLNEDSLSAFVLTGLYESLSKPALGLFIVADGMGGHAGGEIASKFVTQSITDRLVRRVLLDRFKTDNSPREEALKPRVEEAVRYANEQLYRLAQERYSDMGSTVTLALVIDHRVVIANVGDSRVYIHRNGQLEQITKDHSVVASLIAAGMAQPHEIYTHPERNVVYRSMGNRPTVEIDIWEEELKRGDKILLCSDGLWEAIYNEGIEEVLLSYSDTQAATEEMVKRANLAGGEDNITVILAEVR